MLDLMVVRSGALPSELAAEAGLSKSWANRVSRSPVFQRALGERRAALRAALDGEIVQTYSRALCEVRERLDAGELSERGLLDVLDALGRLVAAPACEAEPPNSLQVHVTAEQLTAARRLIGTGRVPAKLPAPSASSSWLLTLNGRIGIGTPTPEKGLHLLASDPDVKIEFSSGATGFAAQVDFAKNGVLLGGFAMRRSNEDLMSNIDIDNNNIGDLEVISGQSYILLEITHDGLVRFKSTGAIVLPVGDDGMRPQTAETGMLRFNSASDMFEGFDGSQWATLGSGVWLQNGNDIY